MSKLAWTIVFVWVVSSTFNKVRNSLGDTVCVKLFVWPVWLYENSIYCQYRIIYNLRSLKFLQKCMPLFRAYNITIDLIIFATIRRFEGRKCFPSPVSVHGRGVYISWCNGNLSYDIIGQGPQGGPGQEGPGPTHPNPFSSSPPAPSRLKDFFVSYEMVQTFSSGLILQTNKQTSDSPLWKLYPNSLKLVN